MDAASEEIAQKLVAINLQILQLMLYEVANKENRPLSELVKEAELEKYLTGQQKIPIHIVYHYAEKAGAKDDFSWYLNRFNYFFNLNQGNLRRLKRFLSKVESRLHSKIQGVRGT